MLVDNVIYDDDAFDKEKMNQVIYDKFTEDLSDTFWRAFSHLPKNSLRSFIILSQLLEVDSEYPESLLLEAVDHGKIVSHINEFTGDFPKTMDDCVIH